MIRKTHLAFLKLTLVILCSASLLTACAPTTALPLPTETATSSPVPTEAPTDTPVPTLTPTPRTPPALPVTYQNDSLIPYGSPHTYVQDTCQYINDKWSSANSAPGTVVMVIMFHSVTALQTVGQDITEADFKTLMLALHDHGFQTVTSAQVADFLEHNAKIPPRSVLLILDDRRPGTVALNFMPYLNDYGWTLTLAWPIGAGDNSTDKKPASNVLPGENFTSLWQQMEAYNTTGKLDIQAHGLTHNIYITSDSTDEFITNELQGSINALNQHFNKVPLAIIWPGGNFTPRAAQIARQLGYRLGFTVNPRGPVMFNWVPLGPERSSWLADDSVNDPLLVLPRYWDTDAIIHIPQVEQAGQEAAAYAEQNKATELEYYDIVCAAQYGPIP